MRDEKGDVEKGLREEDGGREAAVINQNYILISNDVSGELWILLGRRMYKSTLSKNDHNGCWRDGSTATLLLF